MKAAIFLAVVALAAFLYFRATPEQVHARPEPNSSTATAEVPAARVIVPASSGRLADRFKTGQNAQTELKPNASNLKTGPNAQNEWKPNSGQLKTGPNAQTDLTLKRSW